MKRCSTCQRTYADDSQKFCPNDGTPLVSDEPAPFDPEATVMSLSSRMEEEEPPPPPPPPPSTAQPPSPPQPPASYYNPSAQPDQNVHQSYPPSPQGSAPSPGWPPQPPQQQPYYPQPGASQPTPQWQGTGQPPPWMPPGQSPQGQNWGPGGGGAGGAGGYYPQQPGQYAAQAAGGRGLGVAALIVGLISFITFSLVFGMFMRIIPGDRTVAEFSVYTTLLAGIFGAIIGLIALVSSQRRSKMLGMIGMLISIPGILFFIYIASRYGLR